MKSSLISVLFVAVWMLVSSQDITDEQCNKLPIQIEALFCKLDKVDKDILAINRRLDLHYPENPESSIQPPEETADPADCVDIQKRDPSLASGIYVIKPSGGSRVRVYCDLTTDAGGWLVFQRRKNGATDFRQNWRIYEHGFGTLDSEFWLGNEYLHQITSQKVYELRVDIQRSGPGHPNFITYSNISISDSSLNYTLSLGEYLGVAGDCFSIHTGQQFSTFDRDNDASSTHCAREYQGGWWYNNCYDSKLNGRYYSRGGFSDTGVRCNQYDNQSLKFVEMKIRPAGFIG